MTRLVLTFYEVEHTGDLDPILGDLARSGARVVAYTINDDAELAHITVEVVDRAAFWTAFRATESAEWLN
jgi:hypothetical protein